MTKDNQVKLKMDVRTSLEVLQILDGAFDVYRSENRKDGDV
jgi:hypothetical protein